MNTFPLPIYPSQLDSIKTKAKALAVLIAEKLDFKPLSAFKRNDYLSIALGYKGHSDLVESSKFRKEGDKYKPLWVFQNEDIASSIASVFSKNVDGLTEKTVLDVCKVLGIRERFSVMTGELNRMIGGATSDEIKAIQANTTSRLIMKTHSDWEPKSYEAAVAVTDFIIEQLCVSLPEYQSTLLAKGTPTHKLLSNYLEAWIDLKEQAKVALKMGTDKSSGLRHDLRDIQRGISTRKNEVREIIRIAEKISVPVPELEPTLIFSHLVNDNLYFSHLLDNPLWFVGQKDINGITYRYLTQYFADCSSCGGHAPDRKDLLEVLNDNQIGSDEHATVVEVPLEEKLARVLSMPQLCSDVRVVLNFKEAVELGNSVIYQTTNSAKSALFSKDPIYQKKLEKDMAKLLKKEGRTDDLWLLNRLGKK
tara:strand:- start:31984 stop:33246 length:1263 start_codon:yes stop_codon:yes gene_type:complete